MEAEEAEKEAKAERRRKDEEERLKYKGGVTQDRVKSYIDQRLEQEKKAAFATYKDDVVRNEQMKDIDRWGDPMAGLTTSKKKGSNKPKYKGPAPPPNRYGILPGYRWDGVDRGNGFEAKLIQNKYTKNTMAEEAYKWSTEDM
ncbi:Pre-mRNA-splicing factor cwc26 [Blyttiomyces sp. JEL0837]|nr:Pre-mRNA-splicing factor cwc26 [Blyttiomyces sp. JEL0837]